LVKSSQKLWAISNFFLETAQSKQPHIGRKFALSGHSVVIVHKFLEQNQGDQIGWIFAQWSIVFFGQFRENKGNSAQFWATLFHGYVYALIVKKSVGLHFGRFFHKFVWSPWTE
jgi:hypothetical protein